VIDCRTALLNLRQDSSKGGVKGVSEDNGDEFSSLFKETKMGSKAPPKIAVVLKVKNIF